MATGSAGEQLQVLQEAIEGLDLAVHADTLVRARALLDRLTAKVTAAEADYSASGGWQVDGFGSMAAFTRHRYQIGAAEGRRVARRAERMAAWPEMLDAWIDGTLPGSTVEAAVALVPDRHVERFAHAAADNVDILAPLGVADTRTVLRHWVERADTVAEREAAEAGIAVTTPERVRELFVARTLDDVADLRGVLDPDGAAITEQALRAAETGDVDGMARTPAQRRADALVDICRYYLDHHTTPSRNRRPPRLSIVADITVLYRAALRGAGVRSADQLQAFLDERPRLGALERGLFLDAFDGHGGTARSLDGNPISDALLSCVSSGGVLERVLTAESRILDMGRTVRHFTETQRRAAAIRDQGCRRAGCDKPLHMTQLHHVEPWETGGRTDLANAVHKCDHDHLDDHHNGLVDELEPDGTYTITTPTGHRLTTRPPNWTPPHQQPRLTVPTTTPPAPPLPFRPTDTIDDGIEHLLLHPPTPQPPPGTPLPTRRVPLLVIYAA